MGYIHLFTPTDRTIGHVIKTAPSIDDGLLVGYYAGFIAVSAAATFEMCVKTIMIDYASTQHISFGTFFQNHFTRLNAKIDISDLTGYAKRFHSAFSVRFKDLMKMSDAEYMAAKLGNITTAYDNLLTSRHTFAHTGTPPSLSIQEVATAYELGKVVMENFCKSLSA